EPAAARDLDHPLGLVDERQLGAELSDDPLCELALTTADLENASRPELGDRSEEDLPRVRAFRVRVDRLPCGEVRLVRILRADEVRVVKPTAHGSTIGLPGNPRGVDLPPSHAFTVAPTSANSPSSWINPAALRPST